MARACISSRAARGTSSKPPSAPSWTASRATTPTTAAAGTCASITSPASRTTAILRSTKTSQTNSSRRSRTTAAAPAVARRGSPSRASPPRGPTRRSLPIGAGVPSTATPSRPRARPSSRRRSPPSFSSSRARRTSTWTRRAACMPRAGRARRSVGPAWTWATSSASRRRISPPPRCRTSQKPLTPRW